MALTRSQCRVLWLGVNRAVFALVRVLFWLGTGYHLCVHNALELLAM